VKGSEWLSTVRLFSLQVKKKSGEEDNVEKSMPLASVNARVFNGSKMPAERIGHP
jgi:hypothetical protein